MSLEVGKKLGSFEILATLGAGGMGEVYEARDLKLGRSVALKLLPEHLASDKERLERLEREAKSLASIEHPNIASLYSLEEHEGTSFLVMELVAGETLSKRIARGPLPFDEALPLLVQMGEALEAAHARGVLHRDLKPGNVQVNDEGRLKVLDFGLAKSLDESVDAPELTESPTRTRGTEAGVILGTASYMSPEQARGKSLDKRSDIWSYGSVAYEMLTGKKAFDGDNLTDILASIVKSEPDWDALPDGVPLHVRRLLKRCLAKKRDERLRDVGDALLELKEPAPALEVAAQKGVRGKAVALLLGTGLGVMLATGLSYLRGGDVPAPRPPMRLSMSFPADFRAGTPNTSFDLSSDGRTIVYGASGRIYARRFEESEARLLGGDSAVLRAFFSPDGQWVGFGSLDAIYKVPIEGGRATEVARGFVFGSHWARDGFLYFAESYASGISRVPANGGVPETVTRLVEDDLGHWYPWLLPGGDALLFTVYSKGSMDSWEIRLQDLHSGETRPVIQGGYDARYIPAGYLLFGRSGNLMAVRFDPSTREVGGEPFIVQNDVETAAINGYVSYAVSDEGTFLYSAESNDDRLVWVNERGEEREASTEQRRFEQLRVSPDGRRLAVVAREGADRSLWLLDVVRGSFSRLTYGHDDIDPVWSPDGEWVYFTSAVNGPYELFRVRSDGSGEPELILGGPVDKHASAISPNGRELAYAEDPLKIYVLSIETGESRRLTTSPFQEQDPTFSPDGEWIAYKSDESGRFEVYAIRSDGTGAKIPISIDGGEGPAWSRTGDEIFFIHENRMYSVDVSKGLSSALAQPRALFSVLPYRGGAFERRIYDVGPTGEFAMVRTRRGSQLPELEMVLNWFDEVRRLDPASQ